MKKNQYFFVVFGSDHADYLERNNFQNSREKL